MYPLFPQSLHTQAHWILTTEQRMKAESRKGEAGSLSHALPPSAPEDGKHRGPSCQTPFWIPGNSKGAESDTRQQKELLPDGLWHKPPPSFISQSYRAAGNGGGREEDETVGGRLTQKSLGATDAVNSSE